MNATPAKLLTLTNSFDPYSMEPSLIPPTESAADTPVTLVTELMPVAMFAMEVPLAKLRISVPLAPANSNVTADARVVPT